MPRPLPQPTPLTQPFWDAARAERLVIQRCRSCDRVQFYPRPFCTACLAEDLEWMACSGRGSIYTFTINHRGAYAEAEVPYAVAIVELEEGVRMMANIVGGELSQIAIGAPVEVCFEVVSETITLPQFRLSGP